MNAVSRNSGIFQTVTGDGGATRLYIGEGWTQKRGDAVKTAPPWA